MTQAVKRACCSTPFPLFSKSHTVFKMNIRITARFPDDDHRFTQVVGTV